MNPALPTSAVLLLLRGPNNMLQCRYPKMQQHWSLLVCLVQLCAAYRAAGGKTVAVLSCRPKLEMEELFDATIPRSQRHKTRFVFRQVQHIYSLLES